jgi:hypothetical protein
VLRPAELILRDTPHFRGDITGFADKDMIAFMDFLIGSTSVQYMANAGNYTSTGERKRRTHFSLTGDLGKSLE